MTAARILAYAIAFGVVALWGGYGIAILFCAAAAFHIGFRIAKGRWMNVDGS